MSGSSEFAGKRLVVTGGDTPLGLATAHAFMSQGGHVILVGADDSRMAEARSVLGPVRLGPLVSALDTEAACAQALDAAGGPVFAVVCLPHGPQADAGRMRVMAERLAAAFASRHDTRHAARLVLCGAPGDVGEPVRALARTLAPQVLVNAVAPGRIDGDGTVPAGIPLGRAGTVQEVAGVIRFLCSTDAGYVTGQTIAVDGGLSLG
jgi:3-oxoacyl-[acyl-carrier protein] reductase